MTNRAIIRESDARRLAKIAKELNVSIKVEPDGSVTVKPIPIAPIAVDYPREIVL